MPIMSACITCSNTIHADFRMKRSIINKSLADITSYVDLVADAGLLDHTQAQLLPIIASLEAYLQEVPECAFVNDFVVTEKFAPTQKNERQLNFHKKIKTSGRNTAQSHFK